MIHSKHETTLLQNVVPIPQTRDLRNTRLIIHDFSRKANIEEDQLAALSCVDLNNGIKKDNNDVGENPDWEDSGGALKVLFCKSNIQLLTLPSLFNDDKHFWYLWSGRHQLIGSGKTILLTPNTWGGFGQIVACDQTEDRSKPPLIVAGENWARKA